MLASATDLRQVSYKFAEDHKPHNDIMNIMIGSAAKDFINENFTVLMSRPPDFYKSVKEY